jgi:putative molybdopterin biosynthesis protein
MDRDTALKPQEVADMLKITRSLVYRMIRRGELRGYRVGNKVRVDFKDVETYKNRGQTQQPPEQAVPSVARPLLHEEECEYDKNVFVLCGQGALFDLLVSMLQQRQGGLLLHCSFMGGYTGLCALYQNELQAIVTHLWDGETGAYNIPYVKKLLPGIRALTIHLACRMQGLCVAAGNPKGLFAWEDLAKEGLIVANRQKGSATRILLDEHLKQLGLSGTHLDGYRREFPTNLLSAGIVARGGADFSISDEKTAQLVKGVEFIPLQKERVDLVIREENRGAEPFKTILEIVRSPEFRFIIDGIGGYGTEKTGEIVVV